MNKIKKYEKQHHELRFAKLAAVGSLIILIMINCSVETSQEQKMLTIDSIEVLSSSPKVHVLTGDTNVYINKIVNYDSKYFIAVSFDTNEDSVIFELVDSVKIKLKTIPDEDGINSEIIRDAGVINLNHKLNNSEKWFLTVEKGIVHSIDEIW